MRRYSPLSRVLRVSLFGLFWLPPTLFVLPVKALAQGDAGCDVPAHGGMVMTTLSNDTRMFFFTSPTIRCPGGVWITADSARVYEATNYNNLMGNVEFLDEDSRLTADQAQYFSAEKRLVARGNAVLTDLTEGSVIVGDNMILERAGPDRPEDLLTVYGGSPHATLFSVQRPEPEVAVPDTAGQGGPAMAPDSATMPPDSATSPPDSAMTPPDSATSPPDSATTPPDSLIPAGEELPPPTPPVVRAPPEASPEAEVQRVPYEIDAQRFVLEGTRFFRATGSVVVTRDSLTAVADSLEYDQDVGALFLTQGARVTTAQTDLAADAIRLEIPQDEVREAVATGEAVLDGKDLRLLAPIVNLFFTEGRLERLVALRDAVADSIASEMGEEAEGEELLRGALPQAAIELGLDEFPRRPYALAQDFILEGDSMEVLAPEEVLNEVWAIGNARGESTAQDSLAAPDTQPLIARDWLEGDTIVAFFGEGRDSLSAADEPVREIDRKPVDPDEAQADYRLERLVARVGARSMYRMAASDSTVVAEGGRFAIHYVTGDEITILLNEEGEADRMEVIGQTRGIHLEPIAGQGVPVDSVLVPDTSGIRRAGSGVGRPGRGGGSEG
jgi:lipopolysaccharide export system protein LptA